MRRPSQALPSEILYNRNPTRSIVLILQDNRKLYKPTDCSDTKAWKVENWSETTSHDHGWMDGPPWNWKTSTWRRFVTRFALKYSCWWQMLEISSQQQTKVTQNRWQNFQDTSLEDGIRELMRQGNSIMESWIKFFHWKNFHHRIMKADLQNVPNYGNSTKTAGQFGTHSARDDSCSMSLTQNSLLFLPRANVIKLSLINICFNLTVKWISCNDPMTSINFSFCLLLHL